MKMIQKMISFENILLFFVATSGFVVMFCEANILISDEMKKEKQYRMDLEIFKHIDRFHSMYRKAEVGNRYEKTGVFSDFQFFFEFDDNVKELIHYMDFIGTSGTFFDNLTLSYAILYTKYSAAFYAINMLNIYKIKKNKFETWSKENAITQILKKNKKVILNTYLKVGQYLAWYATIGNNVLLEGIQEQLQRKRPCAEESYVEFKNSFNKIIDGMKSAVFYSMKFYIENEIVEPMNLDNFWNNIYENSATDIQITNRYFTALFLEAPENDIKKDHFLETVKKEMLISKFVSDLLIMKGRDIEETYFDFDNEYKKELYEANVANMMMVIEDKEIETFAKAEGAAEKTKARKNQKYIILQPREKDKLYTCLNFQLVEHEILLEKIDIPSDPPMRMFIRSRSIANFDE